MGTTTMEFSRAAGNYVTYVTQKEGDDLGFETTEAPSFPSGTTVTDITFYISKGLKSGSGSSRSCDFAIEFDSGGSWHQVWHGSKTLSGDGGDGTVPSFTFSVDSSVGRTLATYGVDEVRIVQDGSYSLKGMSTAAGTATFTYEYLPTITINSFSVSQENNGNAKFSCKATGTNGSGSITYKVTTGSTTVFSGLTGSSGSTATKTCNIASTLSYGKSYTFTLTATYSGESTTKTASKTFYVPAISDPTSLTISNTSGQTASLNWTAASLSYTTGTIQYKIYQNDTEIKTVSAPPYTLTEDVASTFGTDPVTLTVQAVGTGLSNTYSGDELRSDHTNSVTFTYVVPYTAPGEPTNLNVNGISPAYIKQGQIFTLSWDAASDGNNNPVKSYTIFRDGTQVKTGVTGTSWSEATAHSTAGSYYTYTVQAIGEHLSSDVSDSLVVYSYSDPSVPTGLTINNGIDTYVLSDNNATLKWNAASDGSYNSVTGYIIYQDGVEFRTITDITADVPANTTAGSKYTYSVATKGVRSNSEKTTGVIAYTYAHPEAPAEITVSNVSPDINTEVTLSWNNAKAGNYNAITGYHVYRSTSVNGEYVCIDEGIESTSVSGSCNVMSPSEMGTSYFYKVRTIGARSNSGLSDVYATVTTNVYTRCKEPDTFAVDKTVSSGEPVMLSWSGAAGGTNNNLKDYEIQYAKSSDGITWGSFVPLTTTSETSLNVYPPSEAGSYYKYQIRVRGTKAEEQYYSEWKESDNTLRKNHSASSEFTDSTLEIGNTLVKAIHMTELQNYVNTLRQFNGLGAYNFTQIIAGETSLAGWTDHVQEIRAAIDEISTNHDAWITISINCPNAAVVNQLRNIAMSI